ncbi:hypothetical protein [Planococcus sp. ISL-110]|uniref:hypothetical protein n=1 Tax=Planococcus sp. ISL-110 TaxID=2819167 RepID=UPI001BEB8F60|nr:hypothetical protein [Planococcus sp. ISL-110]MBT2570789.1 hypothetical protein [Planococcus sp. ISL-110]
MQDYTVTDIRKKTPTPIVQEENAIAAPAIPLPCFLNRCDNKKVKRKGHQTMPFTL